MATHEDRGESARISGLLSDIEILEHLVSEAPNCVFVSPLVSALNQVGPSSLDVRLGPDIKVPVASGLTHVDLAENDKNAVEANLRQYFRHVRIGASGTFVLHPGEFALASTLEFIQLPRNIAARLEGRSSLGRLGLQIHLTAGFVDPGFHGTLTLELTNVGRVPVRLRPGSRVAQLCFFRINDVEQPYDLRSESKYRGLLGAEASRFFLEDDR